GSVVVGSNLSAVLGVQRHHTVQRRADSVGYYVKAQRHPRLYQQAIPTFLAGCGNSPVDGGRYTHFLKLAGRRRRSLKDLGYVTYGQVRQRADQAGEAGSKRERI